MIHKKTESIRLPHLLTARCKALAAEQQMSFSEWVRDVLRRAVEAKQE